MSELVSILLGTVVVFPFILTILLLFVFRKRGRSPAKVVGMAADLTTPFLFFAVTIIASTISSDYALYLTVIPAIIVGIVIITIERMRKKDFQLVSVLRKIWRILFLLLSIAYILLILAGLILKIIDYTR